MDLKALFIGALCATQPLGILAQNGMDDPVLMRVDGQPVSRSEFEAIYKKNNQDAPVTREALDEYLELFINYKLKVREAESLGMDTVQKFEQELAGYRDQLARPYLIDRELNEGLIKEAYDRSRWEVRASHILVQMPTDPTPEDTLAAWERITALRDRVVGGEDFAAVAQGRGGSDDPSVSRNGGDLGWFSAMQMVYPFETAAYSTEIGEVSAPVRTRFGYHIIKVMGKREARGQVKVAHIMLRSTEQDDSTRQADAERRIREVYGKLLAGEVSFDDAALRYSEDEATSTKGGELPMFGTGKMIEEFEDVSFALSEDGEVSAPFRTRFGWHIVKRLEYKPPPSFEQARPELKAKIAKDSRAEVTRQAFLARLLQEYGYVPYTGNLKAVSALLDSNFFKKGTVLMDTLLRSDLQEGEFEREGGPYRRELTGQLVGGQLVNVRSRRYDDLEHAPTDTVIVRDVHMGWSYDRKKAAKLTKPVATFDGVSLDQRSLLDYLERVQQRERPVPYSEVVGERFGDFVDERVLQHENDKLEEKYPEFRLLMKEYRDGILLFELTDEKVWSRAVEDSAGLEAYYDAHRLDFMWEPRFKATLYECADSGTSSKVRSLYRKGKRGGEIANELNTTSALNVRVEEGLWTAQEKPYLQGVIEPGLTNNFEVDGRVVIADLQEVLPAAPKTLEEARGSITAAYQDHLEKVWVDELKAKYPVVVDQDVLYSIR
ncbi:MAG: peptidylprolyl isomerase [Flavobacteriales bacterium]|nr:peptidylprolyl isomerase [Flavobacteriales bacterium]